MACTAAFSSSVSPFVSCSIVFGILKHRLHITLLHGRETGSYSNSEQAEHKNIEIDIE
jgi:hypothetical protein